MPGGLMVPAAVVALAASPALAAGAATAAADPAATSCDGVTVVVDYNELGGEDRTACVEPGTAGEAFEEAGVSLEYVPRMQDFVCRVSGVPTDGPCTDGDSYWSLWWSDGTAEWSYASLGVTSLEVPAGGAVGFAWHEGSGDAAPPDDTTPVAPVASSSEDAAQPADDAAPTDDDALPTWTIAGVAGAVLFAAAVPVVVRRRSR